MDRPKMKSALNFLKAHWWHGLLFIPGAIFVTFLHEAAHAVVVIWEGGTVTNFVILPSEGYWGYVEMVFPEDHVYSDFAISIAPYVMWLALSIVALILGKIRNWNFTIASLIFVWLFVIPLADIANALLPWMFFNKANDLYYAFGSSELILLLPLTIAAIGVIYSIGYRLQKTLYRERSLLFLPYTMLFVVSMGGVFFLSCGFG